MRIAYLDCFAGIAGDMLMGALLDAGVPSAVLEQATAALDLDASLQIERVERSGISATKVHVLERGRLAETPDLAWRSSHAAPLEQNKGRPSPLSPQPGTQHRHKGGHTPQEADPASAASVLSGDRSGDAHAEGRSLTAIRQLIHDAALAPEVKALAVRTFELLGASEARIHNVPVDHIHFHEVGAVDAIVDIVGCCAGIHHLAIDAWYCSALNVGSGMVRCAHGNYPVPAPATADLLRHVPTYAAHVQKELVTPTGAALVRALAPQFGAQPPMRVEHTGYGAGTRNPEGFPNVLRLSVGTLDLPASTAHISPQEPLHTQALHTPSFAPAPGLETVAVLETALDDASPQLLAFVAEQLLAEGAFDVMLTPVLMKKGRPGTLLTVLCPPADHSRLSALLLRETPTLGVRLRLEQRLCLERHHLTVETPFGAIRMKVGSDAGEVRNAAPEFEDCKAAALRCQVPLKQVFAAAVAAYTSNLTT